ncbi:hypothetical protein ACWDRR_06690 [Kitasatospora sp. NPDC003701]
MTGRGAGERNRRPASWLRRPDAPQLRLIAALFLLPPLLHLASADLVTFALVWFAAASLIRSRATAFDRMMISGGLLIGWACALSLLTSYWPWGLHPVALAEATAVLLAAVLLVQGPRPAGRRVPLRDRLRLLVPTRDLPLLFSVAASCAFLLYPVVRRDALGRLATVISAEDLARHAALYDTILRLGGLTSLHQGEAAETVTLGLGTYPQGSHLTMAVITSFLHGGTDRGPAITQISLFVALFTLVTAGLTAAVLWAVQRAAGPALRGWRGLALAVPTAVYLVVAELPRMHARGFLSEIFALGLLALLVGLAIRPLSRVREQLVALAALTVGVSFGHYLLLPAAAATVFAWAVVHRRGWRRHWPTALAVSATAGVLALFPPLVNAQSAGSADVLTLPGGIGPVGRNLLMPLVVAAFAALLTRRSLADKPRRVALITLAAISALCFGVMEYQLTVVGKTSYFYEKMIHQLLVIGVISFGAALLPMLGRRVIAGRSDRTAPGAHRTPAARLRTGVALLTATGCLGFAVLGNANPEGGPPGWPGSPGRTLLRGDDSQPEIARRIAAIDAQHPRDGRVPVSLAGTRVWREDKEDWGSAEDNIWLSVLNRNQGSAWEAWVWALSRHSAVEVVEFAASSRTPLRFYVDDASQLLADLKTLTAGGRYPELAVSVLTPDGDGDLTVQPLKSG